MRIARGRESSDQAISVRTHRIADIGQIECKWALGREVSDGRTASIVVGFGTAHTPAAGPSWLADYRADLPSYGNYPSGGHRCYREPERRRRCPGLRPAGT